MGGIPAINFMGGLWHCYTHIIEEYYTSSIDYPYISPILAIAIPTLIFMGDLIYGFFLSCEMQSKHKLADYTSAAHNEEEAELMYSIQL